MRLTHCPWFRQRLENQTLERLRGRILVPTGVLALWDEAWVLTVLLARVLFPSWGALLAVGRRAALSPSVRARHPELVAQMPAAESSLHTAGGGGLWDRAGAPPGLAAGRVLREGVLSSHCLQPCGRASALPVIACQLMRCPGLGWEP